jgi:hypothetical protein
MANPVVVELTGTLVDSDGKKHAITVLAPASETHEQTVDRAMDVARKIDPLWTDVVWNQDMVDALHYYRLQE